MPPAAPSAPSTAIPRHASRDALAWGLAVVMLVEVAVFVVAAGRGLDLTDECFYLLTYRHWTEWPSVSLFGAYFSLAYDLLGHGVHAIRILGLLLLLGAGIWFGHEANCAFDALAGRSDREGRRAASIASGAAIWSYYGAFVVPYTPSYNLLTLACTLLTLALALHLGRAILLGEQRMLHWNAFALGLIGSIGVATKFSAGALVLGLSAVIVCVLGWRRLAARSWARLALATATGIVLNLALLWIADPALPARFQRGIAVTLAMMPRNPSGELAAFAATELPRELMVSLRILLWPLLAAVSLLALATHLPRRRSLIDAIAIASFVVGALLVTFVRENRVHRLVLLTLVACGLALAALWLLRRPTARLERAQAMLVAGAILVVPFAYSIGTNNPLLRHMGMAAIFPSVLAIVQVRVLRVGRAIPAWAFAAMLALLAALPAEILVRQWLDGSYTYRLGAPLAEQTIRMQRNAGDIDVRVSSVLARNVDDFLRLVRDSGFVPGQPMIDFTGQAPGLVALSGGVPLGAIWIIGGPTFDGDEMARISLADVDPRDVRRAWLLTSQDSFARIASWPAILQAKLGAPAHEVAGRVTVADPTSTDKSKTMEVTLWRPKR